MSATQILVVEDERLVATAIQNELEQFGYEVSGIASSAAEAIEKARRHRPDLVLMDIHLKGNSDGVAAVRSIRKQFGVPVVYMSAFSDPDTVARASETEAFGYLIKPYEERELQTTIEMAVAKHRAEQKLEETERWLAAIHNGINESIIALDPTKKIRFMNRAAEDMTGWLSDAAVGQSVMAVCNLVSAGGAIPLDDLLDKVATTGARTDLPDTAWAISTSGGGEPIEGTISPIRDSRGELLGAVLTLRNISGRLEVDRLRRQIDQRKERAQKMEAISRLAGGLAHPLTNLLSGILTNTSLALTEVQEQSDTHRRLEQVELAAQQAAELAQRLTMFSSLAGRPTGQMKELDLGLFLPKFLREISPRMNANIALAYKPAADLWDVAADELLLGQALLELALNSQDAMPRGGSWCIEAENVTIAAADVDEHHGSRAGEFVRLRIGDSGKGMKPTMRALLFDSTFGINSFGAKPANHLVQLGLSLVAAIVEQLQGWIECSAPSKHGSQFDLFLPRFRT